MVQAGLEKVNRYGQNAILFSRKFALKAGSGQQKT